MSGGFSLKGNKLRNWARFSSCGAGCNLRANYYCPEDLRL